MHLNTLTNVFSVDVIIIVDVNTIYNIFFGLIPSALAINSY